MAQEVKMEKDVQKNAPQEQPKKVSYEQLKAYAEQAVEQAKKLYQENQVLKQALNRANIEYSLKEMELAIKCLDHVDLFTPDFIKGITSRLEEVLTPNKEEENTNSNTEE